MAYLVGNKRNDAGLVLHIDPANIKCFRGEPTINYVTNLTGWGSSLTLMSEKLNGYPIYKNKVTNPNVSNNFGIHQPIYTNIPSNTSKITLSFWVRVITMPGNVKGYVGVKYTDNTTEYHHWSYSPNPFNNIIYVGEWVNVKSTITTNVSKTPDSISTFYVYRDNAPYGEMDISQVQIETKDHSTHYVNGTRGTTIATNGGFIDLSKSNNNGELKNNLLYKPDNAGCLLFDDTNSHILLQNSTLSSITNGTISFWSKMVDNSNWLIMSGDTTSYYLLATSGTSAFYNSNCGSPTVYVDGILNNNPPTDLMWHNITATNVNLSTWTIFGLGIYFDYSGFKYNGYIGQILFYNRVLSLQEIQNIYNSSKSRYI